MTRVGGQVPKDLRWTRIGLTMLLCGFLGLALPAVGSPEKEQGSDLAAAGGPPEDALDDLAAIETEEGPPEPTEGPAVADPARGLPIGAAPP